MALDISHINSETVEALALGLEALLADHKAEAGPGTVLNELGIRPLAVLQAHMEKYREEFLRVLDLSRIASGEEEGDDDVMDAIASTFRVVRRRGLPSSGSVMLLLRRPVTTHIGGSYRFYIGDTALSVPGVYVGIPAGVSSGEGGEYVPIVTQGDRSYMVVPVNCVDGQRFSTGTEVSVTGDVSNILQAVVYSPIMGGGLDETNQELARRLLYGVAPGVLSTPLQLRNGFNDNFGIAPHRVAVYGTHHPAQRRDLDAITGLPLGGRVDVALAASGGCPRVELALMASLDDGEYLIQLGSETAAGAYSVTQVLHEGIPVEFSVVWGVASDSGHSVTASTGRWSSLQTATIRIPSAEIEGTPSDISLSATLLRVSGLNEMQRYLDSSDRSAPGQDTLVRAPAPCFLSVDASVRGGSLTVEDLITRVADHLNDLPVGRGYVDAQDIADALRGTGSILEFPVVLTGTELIDNREHTRTTTNGRLSSTSPGAEVVFFTEVDRITIRRTE